MKSQYRPTETCLVIATGMLVIFYLTDLKVFVHIAFGVGLAGVLVKPVARLITWFWGKLGELLGHVVPRIILTAVYFGLLFPLALLFRVFNRDHLKLRGHADSYWVNRNHRYTARDLQHPW